MDILRLLYAIASISIVWITTSSAQVDSLSSEDTALFPARSEELLEQAPQEENVPILDILSNEPDAHPSSSFRLRSRISQALQRSAGFSNGAYLGSPVKSYQRGSGALGEHISGAILFEKDAGEQHLNDFTSGHLMFSNLGPFSKIVIGDYLVEAGQGIALWRGYEYTKGADVITPANRIDRDLLPYVSSGENSFFRGMAVQLRTGKLSNILLYSHRLFSASIDSLHRITAISSSGYFRTFNELTRKNNAAEILFGIRSKYSFSPNDNAGITAYTSDFSHQLFISDGRRFSSVRYSLIAADYNFSYRTSRVFGEWAHSNNTFGGSSGILIAPSDAVGLIVAFRHYPFQFITLHGLGFGEQAATSNEAGTYMGLELKLFRGVNVSSYFDQFKSFEPTSKVVFPSSGNDFLLQVQTKPLKRIGATLNYQCKNIEQGETIQNHAGFSTKINDHQRRQQMRCTLDLRLSKLVRLKGRVEKSFIDTKITGKHEEGLMVFQDIVVVQAEQWWWNVRLIVFHTNSYISRIYEVERDVEGVLTLPGLYGRGVRWYVLMKHRVSDNVECSAKYTNLIREDIRHIGSGLDELPTNHDNRISVQLDITF